jgi:cytochrome c553
VIRQFCLLATASALALSFVHPFGPVRQQRSGNPLPDAPALARVCGDCHSERTEWPLYSYIPGVSWALEKDVAEARARLNLSRWSEYSAEEKRDLLGRIAAETRSHEMPPARYTVFHPEARLSEADIQAIGDWTKAQRHLLRTSPGINQAPQESLSMPQ